MKTKVINVFLFPIILNYNVNNYFESSHLNVIFQLFHSKFIYLFNINNKQKQTKVKLKCVVTKDNLIDFYGYALCWYSF